MSQPISANCSNLALPDLDVIAAETKLVIRHSSKFSPGGFLQSLLSSVATGLGSLNQIASELKDRTHAAMARQSMHDRFTTKSTAFLMSVICDLMEQRFKPAANALAGTEILRVFIEDASGLAFPKANAEIFPAHGNHHGKTAGVKVDLTFDLLSQSIISHSLEAATTQDTGCEWAPRTYPKEVIIEVGPGDLVLRDMGYFSLNEFGEIEVRGAWWLTRLPLNVGVLLENGKALETRLNSRRQDILDLEVRVGEVGKKCRLVAVRADPQVARGRRAARRKKAASAGKKPCRKGLIRDGWHLMLTNLDKEKVKISQLVAIYRARWAVEIQFRAWKQALNLDKALNRESNEHHMQALVLAGMIAHQLGMKIAGALIGQIGRARMSYERLYDILALYLIKSKDIADLINFSPDIRHISRGKSAAQSPIESGILALS
jgi:hypothetical protein